PAAVGQGISGGTANNVTVMNGTIRGMHDGIVLGNYARVEGVRTLGNFDNGIYVTLTGIVKGNIAAQNGNRGIATAQYALIDGNVVYDNGGGGINAGGEAKIRGRVFSLPTSDAAAAAWGPAGIGATLSSHNSARGILAAFSTVRGNTAFGNTDVGLNIGASGYAENLVSNNNGGDTNPQVSGGLEMSGDVCGGDLSCP